MLIARVFLVLLYSMGFIVFLVLLYSMVLLSFSRYCTQWFIVFLLKYCCFSHQGARDALPDASLCLVPWLGDG